MTGQVQMFAQMFQQGGFNGNIEDEEGEVIGGAVLQQFLQKAPALINELDEVLCGVAIAADGKSAHLDCRLTAVAGTATARKFARLKGTTTLLAGFGLPEAAVTAHWVAAMDDFDLAQATNSLAGFQAQAARRLEDSEDLTKDQAQVAKQLLSDAVAVVQKTLQGKKIDCGLAFSLRPRASTLLCGGVIAGGENLDKVVKRLIAQIRADDPDSTKSLKLDAEVHDGVHFHVAATSSPPRTWCRCWARGSRWCWASAPTGSTWAWAATRWLREGGHYEVEGGRGRRGPAVADRGGRHAAGRLRRRDLGRPRQAQGGEDRRPLEKIPREDHATLM